jgi:site-specific DNA-methyltransferase (adenine-specific)
MSLPSPYYDRDGITIYHGDCREVLSEIASVDLVVTDPPYTFGLNSVSGKLGWGDLMNAASFYADILRKIALSTRPRNGAAWIFNSWRTFPVIAKASWEAQWAISSLLVWDKGPEVGMGGTKGLRAQYELVALFLHDGFRITDRSAKDIVNIPWGGSAPREFHAAQKPVAIFEHLMRISLDDSGLVLDPFMGSGTALVAAKQTGHHAIGIEIEERYCEIAVQRLAQSVLPFGVERALRGEE